MQMTETENNAAILTRINARHAAERDQKALALEIFNLMFNFHNCRDREQGEAVLGELHKMYFDVSRTPTRTFKD